MLEVDLTNLDVFESGQAEAVFAQLRQEAPVYWNQSATGDGFWVLTRYKEVAWAWKQTRYFSSECGNMLRLRGHKDPAAGKMMVVTDPPRHTLLRNLLNHGFTPQSVAWLEADIRSFACELLDQVTPQISFDFVSEIATRLPISVTCQLMGIPRADWKLVADLSAASTAAEDREFWTGSSVEQTLALANTEILFYLADLITQRRQKPGQDIISTLVALRIDGHSLGDEEIALNCFSFLLGANETTRYAAVAGLHALIQWPREYQRLQENPLLMTTAIDEVLRWATPSIHVLRVATRDIRLGDHMIQAGDTVTLWNASANRDEAVFPAPYTFDVGRTPNRHLTFGIGSHYCIGANIARLELKALFQEILLRDYRFEMTREPSRLRSNFLAGFKHLHVRLLA